MTDSIRSYPSRAFLAVLGLAMLVGAVAGLADALTSPAPAGHAAAAFWTSAFGALIAFLAFLPVAVLLALLTALGIPRSAAGPPAITLVLLLAVPGAVALGRSLYHRLPWGAGELATAAGAAALLIVLCAAAAAAAGLLGPARGAAISRGLARVFVPALLLALPAGGRIAASARVAAEPGASHDDNLLLLTVDTLRPDALGCTGSPLARTPCIDRIARGSILFSDCVAPSPWTLPSLGTVLTGRYPGEHRVLEALSGISPDVLTLAEAAKRHGRRTAAFVSNPWLAAGGLSRGFDTFDVAERLESLGSVRFTRLGAVATKTALRLQRLDSADHVTGRALRWIAAGEGAWFLWLHLFDPHLPNQPPAPWDRLFGPPPVHTDYGMEVEDVRAGRYSGGEEGRREIARLYHAEVAYTDRAVGAVWKTLEAQGELERTAIVFSADHGEELWDHEGYGHGHAMHDEVVRVPWLVRPAGGEAGRV
ncbi:MAG TPA: sulfatase, partial [bacterium]|nr:sulfatase [bacterium]